MIEARPITGQTRVFGMIGDPIRQVRSPANFNALAAAAGVDAVLVPMHVPQAEFDDVAGALKRLRNVDGFVVTVPFKERALTLADELLANASRVGAVNALRRASDGSWTGEIFDGVGFVGALRAAGVDAADDSVFMLGAGGAARAIAVSLADAGARHISVFDTNASRAHRLVDDLSAWLPGCLIEAAADASASDQALLVNATPVGLRPDDPSPFGSGSLDRFRTVVDIVPSASPTRLMRDASAAGCVVIGGQAMIDAQASAIAAFLTDPRGEPEGNDQP